MIDRARVRELTSTARALLREAREVSDGDLPTIRENIGTAIAASTDALDALQAAVDAELREWADLHGENVGELVAEAEGLI